MVEMTKQKRFLKNFEHLWNSQTIEVKGKIYMTGGSVANTKTYLKTNYILNETTWEMNKLADMMYERDAHGIASWKHDYIIVAGSWHTEMNKKMCEMY